MVLIHSIGNSHSIKSPIKHGENFK